MIPSVMELIKSFFHELRTKDKCFEKHRNKNNICYGMHGGDSWSENHSYKCMDCPHLSIHPQLIKRGIITAKEYREKILKAILEYEKQLDPVEQCDVTFAIGELYEIIRAVETS